MKIIPNIKFKSVLQPIKNIEERNKAFNKLSNEGKRLEIAWDCLQLILLGKVKGSDYSYWSGELSNIETSTSQEFQQKLNKELPNCKVCARGGMILSQIRLGNKIGCDDSSKEDGVRRNIKGFTLDIFLEMENEYERSQYNHPYYSNTTKKLANICCNILVNGNFNNKDKTDYLTIEN